MNSRILVFYFFLFISCFSLFCQWSNDPAVNLQVTDWGRNHRIASDGNGGVYIGLGRAIGIFEAHHYLLHLDRYGYRSWSDSIRIGGIEDEQDWLTLISDNHDGVLAAFFDLELITSGVVNDYDISIRVQRIDNTGSLLWGDGVRVSLDTMDQYDYSIAGDGNGGCYISFAETRETGHIGSTGYHKIQYILSTGQRAWGDSGIILADNEYFEGAQQIISDGVGGVIIDDYYNENDSLLRRMDPNGNVFWEVPKRIQYGKMVNDRNGGLIYTGFSWVNNNTKKQFKVERIDSLGILFWPSPILIVDSVGNASEVIDVNYNKEYTINIFWKDFVHPGGIYNSYFQGILNTGVVQYPHKGLKVSATQDTSILGEAMVKSDSDYIPIFVEVGGYYAQKISINGEIVWDDDIIISTRASNSRLVVKDHTSGFISVWRESIYGIWAQQVSKNGNLGEVLTKSPNNDQQIPSKYVLLSNFPNPFNSITTVQFNLNKKAHITLKIYDIQGRQVQTIYDFKNRAGEYKVNWNGTNSMGQQVSTGIYILRMLVKSKHDVQQINRKIILLK